MGLQRRRIVLAAIWVAVAVAVAVLFAAVPSAPPRIMGVLLPLFFGAVTAGVIVRFIRARKGSRWRNALGPVAGAADAYQQLLLGRDSVSTCIEKSFAAGPTDVTTGELPRDR
jgi:peptidoglycan/LPS O-acetylase OafA/YrhL